MSWKRNLEIELEVAVANALGSGPATEDAARIAERNMRGVIDRFMAQGRIPSKIKGYHLSVEGGSGLTIDLRFEEHKLVESVNLDLDKA